MAYSALEGRTDYRHGLVARTVAGGLAVMDPGVCRIDFAVGPDAAVEFAGDWFTVKCGDSAVSGVILDAHHLLLEGPCRVVSTDANISNRTAANRLLLGSTTHFDASRIDADLACIRERRLAWVSRHLDRLGVIEAPSRRTLSRALTMMRGQVYSPEGAISHRWTTPDRWPHKDMWLWDSGFHAIGWRHVDPGLAMEMIEGMLDLQREDGFLTYRGTPDGPYFHLGDRVTQPPVLAHAANSVYGTTGDRAWIERIYPRLAAYVEWDLRHRDLDGGGLLEWFIEDDETCRSGESGMDNSPRFDEARRLDAVDFNAFIARECEVLAGLAAELGCPEEQERWAIMHRRMCELINDKCWSEQDDFYFDYDPGRGARTDVWASSGFLPLFCGAASEAQAAALARHLADPGRFGTKVPVPSIAVCDTVSYAKDMWRGPTWANINWVIASGFDRYGLVDAADRIREATIDEVERTCEKFGTFFEYFDDRGEVEPPDLLRKGENAPEKNPYRQVIHEFGWTATLYVDFLMQKRTEGHRSSSARARTSIGL